MTDLVLDEEKIASASHRVSCLKQHLAISTALASVVLLGYGGRNAYAACVGAGGTYVCSGATNTTTYTLTGSPLSVTTSSGFAIATTAGAAFDLDGTNGLTFTDNFASDITGNTSGILANNTTSGALSITTTGNVVGLGNYGIYADNSIGGTNLSIDSANVTGATHGIYAINDGSGFLSITTTGTVDGDTDAGIYAHNRIGGTNLSIDSANVTGATYGIYAKNDGSGFLSITTTGTVDGDSETGIYAHNRIGGTNLSIDSANVIGATHGIDAKNDGSGFLSITTTGTVDGDTETGIYAHNRTGGTNLSIDSANVAGATYGIYAINDGSGFLSITTTGTVDGDSDTGIYAHNRIGGTNLSIDSANVTGATYGIYAINDGSGFLSITASGDVEGSTDDGIEADLSTNGTNLTIDVAKVTGSTIGIDASNNGSGFLSITASGDVEGSSDDGIEADLSAAGTNLIIDVANVTGGITGIEATNNGSGFLSITASGDVNATTEHGIHAINNAAGTDLTINAANVTSGAGFTGIYADQSGSGQLSITTTGLVDGGSGQGIFARTDAASTDMIINAASVTGGAFGIQAQHSGTGILSIKTTGTVTGGTSGSFDGIFASNGVNGGDITIDTAAVYGDSRGIVAANNGIGDLSITSSGSVEATSGAGIIATTGVNSQDVSINVVSVTGTQEGVSVIHNGLGALSIRSTGLISGSTDGLSVSNGVASEPVTIDVVDVYGLSNGIDLSNFKSGPTTISVSGDVDGQNGYGIRNSSVYLGTTSTITLNSGANVFGGNGTSILDGLGDTTVLVKSGAQVRGDVMLASGSDNLIFDGGTFGAGDVLDGGDDTSSADGHVDKLTINGMTTTVLTGQIINWEQLAFVGSDFEITGDLATPELLSLTGGSILTVDGNFDGVAGGKLELDADLASDSASTLVVTGNTTGATTISVDAGSTGPATGNDITLVTVNGTKTAGDFVLDGNPIGAYVFDLALTGDDFALTNATLSPETPVFEAFPQVLASLNGISNFNERFGERYFAATDSAALGYALMGYASTDAVLETDSVQRNNAVWARIEGSHSKLASAQSTTSSQFDTNQGKLQVGLDAMLADGEQGALFVGVNASYGKARSDISSSFGNGQIDASGTAIGASLTWLASSGFYADGQAQFSWFNSDISSDVLGQLESGNDGTGHVLSLEIGHRFENSNGVALTPQAQLVYSEVDFEDFTSAYGTSVTADETESLNLRVGMAVERGFSVVDDAGNGGFGNVQLIANVYHEFRNEMSVSVAGTPLANEADDWTGELGLGGSFTSADGVYTVFGNASASGGLDNTFDSYAFDGSAGVKVAF